MIISKGIFYQVFNLTNILSLTIGAFCLIITTKSIQAATLNVPSVQYPTIQSAVNAANPGDTIILQAGITFTESVVLKYKPGSDYITIQSSALSNLPPDGQRINPLADSQYMPKVIPPNNGSPAVTAFSTEITANGPTHHYRLIGIEMAITDPAQFVTSLVTLGSDESDQNTLAKVAHHFVIDRCYIHGHPTGRLRRGIALNSSHTNIVNSHISEIHQYGFQSQAIAGWNGPGPYLIKNNNLQAASENIIFGGNDPAIPNLVPSDIEIRHNLLTKNLSWYGQNPIYQVANIFELKNARRVTVEENILENNWAEIQAGWAVQLTDRNQNGTAPWSIIEDVNFRYNLIRNTPAGFNLLGQDAPFLSQNMRNMNISYNLISSISTVQPNAGPQAGKCFQLVNVPSGSIGTQNLTLNHNTCVGRGTYPFFIAGDSSTAVTGFDIKNNIAMSVDSGTDTSISGNDQYGTAALNSVAGNTWSLQRNILMLPNGSSQYPNCNISDPNCNPNNINYYVNNPSSVGFVDFANGNYALRSDSPYHNQGTDMNDPGANIAFLNQKKACIESGIWTTCFSNQTPYLELSAPIVPATLEVENFDKGGQGIAYNENYGSTGSSAYRSNPVESVDILNASNASNNFVVFEAAANEWLEYTVIVPSSGLYNFKVRYSSGYSQPNSIGQFKLEVCEPALSDGVSNCVSSGNMTVNSTGGWNTFQTVSRTINIPSSGTHILRLIMVTNAPGDTACNCVVANFDLIAINKGGTLFDFDNDRIADISVFRPSDGTWYLQQSTNGNSQVPFGISTDTIAPADFDGDGKTDVAVWRPSTGVWYILNSSNGLPTIVTFGLNGDIPVQADYDADGKADIAVWRPSTGVWYISKSTGGTTIQTFGQNGDKLAVGDYDGDRKYDLAVFRPANGQWHILRSSNSNYSVTSHGISTDKIIPADYDGDGKTDIAVWRPSNSNWYILKGANGQNTTTNFGLSDDIPVPADYDADGKTDIAVYRPTGGVWHLLRTTTGYTSLAFGLATDIPTPSTYVRKSHINLGA